MVNRLFLLLVSMMTLPKWYTHLLHLLYEVWKHSGESHTKLVIWGMFVYNHASGLYHIEGKSKSSRFEWSPRREKSSFSPLKHDSVTGDTIQTLDPLVPGNKRGENTFGGKNGWATLQFCRPRVYIHHMGYIIDICITQKASSYCYYR